MSVNEPKYRRDIDEPIEEPDATEAEPLEFWARKQRELVTSTVDYNLKTLADLVESGEIDLSPKYQRRFRWDEVRQSRLIESFLMNVPVPPIFLNEDAFGQYSVIDGKQRLLAISQFLHSRLRLKGLHVFSDINNQMFNELPSKFQTVIRTRPTLRSIIILHQSDEDVKFEVFQRLNTGGVHLNSQEIRNSTYPGPLNDMILDLSENRKFHGLLGVRGKAKSAIYQEMRDAELVLRFFTFKASWANFTGGMKRHMDHYMAEHQRMHVNEIQGLRQDFLRTLDSVEACFGEHAFQRWMPDKGQWRQQVLASLYDAEMFACQEIDPQEALAKRNKIIPAIKELFTVDEFRKAIDAATNTPSYFRSRILIMNNMLNGILSE